MTPFADEIPIEDDICGKGQVWHRKILARMLASGVLVNAYNNAITALPNASVVDCFLGGLVAIGVPPQMVDTMPVERTSAALERDSRVRYWNEMSNMLGHAMESGGITRLHLGPSNTSAALGDGSIFLVEYTDGAGGSDALTAPYQGIYTAGSEAWVLVPPSQGAARSSSSSSSSTANANNNNNNHHHHTSSMSSTAADNSTFIVYASGVPVLRLGFGTPQQNTVHFFAASPVTLAMGGPFFQLDR